MCHVLLLLLVSVLTELNYTKQGELSFGTAGDAVQLQLHSPWPTYLGFSSFMFHAELACLDGVSLVR